MPSQISWLGSIARSSVLSFLRPAIKQGFLEIKDGAEIFRIGEYSNAANSVYIDVHSEHFWRRVFVSGDLGFSESYMLGEVDIEGDNLKGVMDLWLENESGMIGLSSVFSRITSTLSGWINAFLGQRLGRARLNVMASYDQSNELFQAFLSQEMMYSCALWGDEEGGVRGDIDPVPASESPSSSTGTLVYEPSGNAGALESAQQRKIAHVLRQLRLRPGGKLLEFGSGWGAMAISAARDYDVEVDTLTLSIEQKRLAEERIREAGLESRIRVHLMDYREVPAEWNGTFDAFVSIEMIEHVGAKYYETYFSIIDRMLKPTNAIAVVSSSTFPESRFSAYQAEDFMRRYMWPNSCLPSATALITAVHHSSSGRFTLERVENHAAHYSRTLREWGRRLEARLTPATLGLDVVISEPTDQLPSKIAHVDALFTADKGVKPAASLGPTTTQLEETLLRHLPLHKSVDAALDYQAIKRKWQYLFAYAAAGFTKGYITCHMLTFVRGSDAPVP